MRYTMVEQTTGHVVNVVELDDPADWPAPEGLLLVVSEEANIGDTYDQATGEFHKPVVAIAPPTKRDYVLAVQAVLDQMAQERDYDTILSACSYVGSNVARFNSEGVALKAWRDQVWDFAAQQLDKVQQGEIPQPTVEAFIASLPPFTWPAS